MIETSPSLVRMNTCAFRTLLAASSSSPRSGSALRSQTFRPTKSLIGPSMVTPAMSTLNCSGSWLMFWPSPMATGSKICPSSSFRFLPPMAGSNRTFETPGVAPSDTESPSPVASFPFTGSA